MAIFSAYALDALVGYSEYTSPTVKSTTPVPECTNNAGKIPAKGMREPVKTVSPSSQPHFVVGSIHAGSVNVDHHFAGPAIVQFLAVASISGPP